MANKRRFIYDCCYNFFHVAPLQEVWPHRLDIKAKGTVGIIINKQ